MGTHPRSTKVYLLFMLILSAPYFWTDDTQGMSKKSNREDCLTSISEKSAKDRN